MHELLEQRCPVADTRSDKITIANANEILNSFSREEAARSDLVGALARELPIREQVCLVRLILKDLKLGLPDSQILKAIHPRAPDLFYTNPDLESLCTMIAEGVLDEAKVTVRVFHPVAPMLSMRVDFATVAPTVASSPADFQVESKIDGERIQLHYDGDRFAFFSRNGADYSHLYGTSSSLGPFTMEISGCFDREKVKSIILDGEMIHVDDLTLELIPFGSKKPIPLPAANVTNSHPCCMVLASFRRHQWSINDTW